MQSASTEQAGDVSAAAKAVADEKENVAALRQSVARLQNEVTRLEAQVTSLGADALVMPEDLGDWTEASPRILGLVARINQAHTLSISVAALSKAPPTNKDPHR